MNLRPSLHSSSVWIDPLKPIDFNRLFAVAKDPLIWKQHPVQNRYQLEPFKAFFKILMKSGGALIITTPDGRVVGTSSYYDYEPKKSRIVIGYTFIAREFWGGKYNSEIKRLMMEHAFRSVETIHFHVGRENVRSRRALEKIGASLIGESEIHGQIRLVYEKHRD